MDEYDELLLDVLNQSCGNAHGEIDNRCLSAYEKACNYLKKKGILEEVNSRIYYIVAVNVMAELTEQQKNELNQLQNKQSKAY